MSKAYRNNFAAAYSNKTYALFSSQSHLVRPKDAVEPTKQDGVVYRIPCECGKVYIGETGRSMQDRIKEHERDIRLARTQTSAVSEHANNTGHNPLWNQVKFIDRDPHWCKRRVEEAIHIRLHPNNINRDSGIPIILVVSVLVGALLAPQSPGIGTFYMFMSVKRLRRSPFANFFHPVLSNRFPY